MRSFVDIAGKRFGRLVVLACVGKTTKWNHIHWNCLCDCGVQKEIAGHKLRNGHTQSCGCLHREQLVARNKLARPKLPRKPRVRKARPEKAAHERKPRLGRRTHGAAGTSNKTWTPEYRAWVSMKTRCTNKKRADWPAYGGRGITISDRWIHSFQNFYADMGDRPSPKHSLDRIDVNGNYEPGNCRWATWAEQYQNTRKAIAGRAKRTGQFA